MVTPIMQELQAVLKVAQACLDKNQPLEDQMQDLLALCNDQGLDCSSEVLTEALMVVNYGIS